MAIAVLTAGAVLSAHIVLQDSGPLDHDGGDTLSLAPLSLGNPAAAAVNRLTVTGPALAYPNRTLDADGSFNSYSQSLRVGRGDTLSGMLNDVGVPDQEAQDAIQALGTLYNARKLRAGDILTVHFKPEAGNLTPGRFIGISLAEDVRRTVVVSRTESDGFTADRQEKTLTREPVVAKGTITSSLYAAGDEAGVPMPVLIDLIKAFSWDVDFQRDIREGDGFEVMYEALADPDGAVVDTGNILFASLTLSGERMSIYRHTTADGETSYFNDKGHGSRKALLRTPIDGARLSSRFGNRRHPILGYTKRHTGVDFAAPTGTPIYAAGDGVVDFAGRKGGYGNYIRLRHNGEYKTAYAHMSRFAKGMTPGRRVRQGEIVGFVGTTGRSTGPHLHYEILRNDHPTNPLTVKMPSGRKLEGKELARFEATRNALAEQYAAVAGGQVASAADSETGTAQTTPR